ncbi:MAG: hydroxyacid dehydrogenase, partial [Candidatus Kaiserbacteria bacterium GW2011_GWC2_52_8b]
QEVLSANTDAEVVSLFTTSSLKKEDIERLPSLKCIVARSTGVDHIDVAAAKEKGIPVCNVPRYGARTVAEFTFALMLSLSRRIFDAFHQIRESGSFKTGALEGFDLYGKTLGVIGTGAIGHTVVGIAKGFGMQVRMFDLFPDQKLADASAQYVSVDELLAQSDIITLHTPYTKENHHLLNADSFAKMKKGVFVINTARGELIDTDALVEALKVGQVAGAGLDVLEEERLLKDEMELVKGIESINALKVLIKDHVLIDMPRVIITPHIAFFSREAYQEILQTSLNNIKSFTAGTPTNVVQ